MFKSHKSPRKKTTFRAKKESESWKAVKLIDERSGNSLLGITFPTHVNRVDFDVFDDDLAENPSKLRALLKRRGAAFLGTKKDQVAFVRALVKQTPHRPQILAARPGFREHGFVLGRRMIGQAQGMYRWLDDPHEPQIGVSAGSWNDWRRDVGQVVEHSSFASFGIMIALAACLPGYVRQKMLSSKQIGPLLSETAVFNYAGESGTGRTVLSQAASGIIGSPAAIITWEFTRRGLEESCEARNDLVLVLDDTEKNTDDPRSFKTALRIVNQVITSGQSKVIAKVARQNSLPSLRWSTFGITSSPKPLEDLAEEVGWKRSKGERVRWIDISVPPPSQGGMFDCLTEGDSNRVGEASNLIARLERGVAQNFGLVFPRWVEYLLEEDRSRELFELVDKFVCRVARQGEGWDQRFAKKFAVVFAAGKLATKAGILPWNEGWAWKAVRTCYRRALAEINADEELAQAKLRGLWRLSGDRTAFLRVLTGSARVAEFTTGTLGIICTHKNNKVCGVRENTLRRFAGSKHVTELIIAQLLRHGALGDGQGHARTCQLPVRIKVSGKTIRRPRFFIIDLNKLKAAAATRKR